MVGALLELTTWILFISFESIQSKSCSVDSDCDYPYEICSGSDFICYKVFNRSDYANVTIYDVSDDTPSGINTDSLLDHSYTTSVTLSKEKWYRFDFILNGKYWVHDMELQEATPTFMRNWMVDGIDMERAPPVTTSYGTSTKLSDPGFPMRLTTVSFEISPKNNYSDVVGFYIAGAYGTPLPSVAPSRAPSTPPSSPPTYAPSALKEEETVFDWIANPLTLVLCIVAVCCIGVCWVSTCIWCCMRARVQLRKVSDDTDTNRAKGEESDSHVSISHMTPHVSISHMTPVADHDNDVFATPLSAIQCVELPDLPRVEFPDLPRPPTHTIEEQKTGELSFIRMSSLVTSMKGDQIPYVPQDTIDPDEPGLHQRVTPSDSEAIYEKMPDAQDTKGPTVEPSLKGMISLATSASDGMYEKLEDAPETEGIDRDLKRMDDSASSLSDGMYEKVKSVDDDGTSTPGTPMPTDPASGLSVMLKQRDSTIYSIDLANVANMITISDMDDLDDLDMLDELDEVNLDKIYERAKAADDAPHDSGQTVTAVPRWKM